MYTRCPKCSTCFRVTDRHLSLAKGKVRCGQCRLVFNAPEHAIDDLPVKTIPTETKVTKTTSATPVTKEEKTVKPAKVKNPEVPVIKKTKTATPAIKTPQFDANATMLADVTTAKNDNSNKINLDVSADNHDDIEFINDDDLFDDSFDLDAAIDELTQATEDAKDIIGIKEEPEITKPEKYIPTEENDDGIFTTDAYAATSAASITDIMEEMESQLPLDIAEPDNNNKEYNADDEFNFMSLTDELEVLEKQEDNKHESESIKEDAIAIVQENNKPEDESIKEDAVDADELFDQVDLSDFQDSENEKDIITDDYEQNTIAVNVPLQLRNDIERLQAAPPRLKYPLFGFPFLIILLVLSFSQLAYFRAHDLVNFIPSTRPLLEKFCDTVSCFYSGPSDTKQIELLSRDVRLHPKEKKALLISASIINNANFAQPYPNIHIRLSDISGNVVAERIFSAKTYIGKLNNPFLLMKSKTPVHINFEVVDPGKDAINFEFSFL